MKIYFSILLLFITINSNASILFYTDQTAWENALLGATFIEETFEGEASDFGANSANNSIGTMSIDIIGHAGDSTRMGLTGDGFFEGEVDSSSFTTSDGASIRFNISTFAFSLLGLQDNNSTPNLDLEEFGIDILGEKFLFTDILGLSDPNSTIRVPSFGGTVPFLGVISTNLINSFTLIHGDLVRPVNGGNEAFWLDGITYTATAVPEPTSLALLGLGLAGFGFSRKKKA